MLEHIMVKLKKLKRKNNAQGKPTSKLSEKYWSHKDKW